MDPLSRQQLHELLDTAMPGRSFSDEQKDRAFEISDGHPLYANYLINQIRVSDDVSLTLDNARPYSGDIESTYLNHWYQFQDHVGLKGLLGKLCRLRRAIDLEWVITWADEDSLDHFLSEFHHYFKVEHEKRWYFFHNSFRLFLIDKTAELGSGTRNDQRDRKFHSDLAAVCADSDSDSFWAWEELHHRVEAGQPGEVLRLATQQYFRRQFLALRHRDYIEKDLVAAIDCAAELQDAVALIRLILAGAEFQQRENALESISISELGKLLMEQRRFDILIDLLRDGNHLNVDPETALITSRDLYAIGMEQEAVRIFDLAEPMDTIRGRTPVASDGEGPSRTTLIEWIRSAVYFRSIDSIVASITKIKYQETDSRHFNADEMTSALCNELLRELVQTLAARGRWDELAELFEDIQAQLPASRFSRSSLRFRGYEQAVLFGNTDFARTQWKYLVESNECKLTDIEVIELAELMLRHHDDNHVAGKLLRSIAEPTFPSSNQLFLNDLAPFDFRFKYHRLARALGDLRTPQEFVPDPESVYNSGLAALERIICDIAQLWGKAWAGEIMGADEVRLRTQTMLRLIATASDRLKESADWHHVGSHGTELIQLLVNAVNEHGNETVRALHGVFEDEWLDHPGYWSPSRRRDVALMLHAKGAPTDWVRDQLAALDEDLADDLDVAGRVTENFRQAQTWQEIGDQQQSETCMDRTFKSSFGVGYRKDYQLNYWIEWLSNEDETHQSKLIARVLQFASVIENLGFAVEPDTSRSAAERLIAVSASIDSATSNHLVHRFIDKDVVGYSGAIRSRLVGAA